MKANDEWEPFKRIGQAALIGFVIATLIVLLAGCSDKPLTPAQQTEHDGRRARQRVADYAQFSRRRSEEIVKPNFKLDIG